MSIVDPSNDDDKGATNHIFFLNLSKICTSTNCAKRNATPDAKAQIQNGIYGANYKITMIISMFIQAFRYASEPFFFNNESQKNSKEVIADIMNYIVIILVFIFLVITLYLHVFKYFIPNPIYWDGLKVVPILLCANIFLGIYTTLSMWYKLTKQTKYGAYISGFGAMITFCINLSFIPIYGYIASAYATLFCYGSMMVISYLLGQRFYPVPYNLKKIFLYLGIGALIYFISSISMPFNPFHNYGWFEYTCNSLLILVFIIIVYFLEIKGKKIITS